MSVRKSVFDAVRSIAPKGVFGDPKNVAALDALLDSLGVAADNVSRGIGPIGISLIKRFEGCAKLRGDGLIEAYPDPGTGGAPWTIGWGATGAGIAPGTVWTQAECDKRLESDLARFAADVSKAIGDVPTTPAQFDALVSFHYNTGAIATATLTKLHKAGDFRGAEREFAKWVNAGGKKLTGLVRRRAAEAELYASGS